MPVYPVGYKVTAKAWLDEWDPVTCQLKTSGAARIDLPLKYVMPDYNHIDSHISDRLIFEADLPKDADGKSKHYNRFEAEVYWENSRTDNAFPSEDFVGRIYDIDMAVSKAIDIDSNSKTSLEKNLEEQRKAMEELSKKSAILDAQIAEQQKIIDEEKARETAYKDKFDALSKEIDTLKNSDTDFDQKVADITALLNQADAKIKENGDNDAMTAETLKTVQSLTNLLSDKVTANDTAYTRKFDELQKSLTDFINSDTTDNKGREEKLTKLQNDIDAFKTVDDAEDKAISDKADSNEARIAALEADIEKLKKQQAPAPSESNTSSSDSPGKTD